MSPSTTRDTAVKWTAYGAACLLLLFGHELTLSHLRVWGIAPFLPPLLPCCDLPRNTSAEYQTIRYRHWTRRSSRFRMEASLRGRLHFLP